MILDILAWIIVVNCVLFSALCVLIFIIAIHEDEKSRRIFISTVAIASMFGFFFWALSRVLV